MIIRSEVGSHQFDGGASLWVFDSCKERESLSLFDRRSRVSFESINRSDCITSRGELSHIYDLLDHTTRKTTIPTHLDKIKENRRIITTMETTG